MPGPVERAQHLGRGVGPQPRATERGRDLVGEPDQPARRAAARRRVAEQLAQQLVVVLLAPRQPVVAHLGGEQGTGRLGRREQPEPPRCGRRFQASELLAVHPGEVRQMRRSRPTAARRAVEERGVEQRVLACRPAGPAARAGGSAGTGAPVSRAQTGGERPRRAPLALGAEQQRLDELEVVAARHRDAGRAAAPDRARRSTATASGRRPRARARRSPRSGRPRARARRSAAPSSASRCDAPRAPHRCQLVGDDRDQHSAHCAAGHRHRSAPPAPGRPLPRTRPYSRHVRRVAAVGQSQGQPECAPVAPIFGRRASVSP